jgi:hypothetical protein
MLKRGLSGFLWLITVWFGYELLLLVVDAPRFLGPVLGLSLAAFVMVDPRHVFWSAPARPTIERSADEVIRLAEIEAHPARRAA